jgi:hypothetical protein
MTHDASRSDVDARQYAYKAMTWCGWGCADGLGRFIPAIGGFAAPIRPATVMP